MRRMSLAHEFVEYVPAALEEGVIYVSLRFATVVHLCPCGCASKVVTPLSPSDWQLIFDGEAVSLTPSIGNWSLPCQSHYWIKLDRVRVRAAVGRRRTPDQLASETAALLDSDCTHQLAHRSTRRSKSWLHRLLGKVNRSRFRRDSGGWFSQAAVA